MKFFDVSQWLSDYRYFVLHNSESEFNSLFYFDITVILYI